MSKYTDKAKDSFNTKWKLFCFAHIIGQEPDFSILAFKAFVIEDDLIRIFTTEYHQYEHHCELSSVEMTVDDIYIRLKELDEDPIKEKCLTQYIANFTAVFPEINFNDLIDKTEKCYYCKTTKTQFDLLYDDHKIYKKAERGWKFEIDRKEPNKEYFEDNCVMSCYWCNNAKTDEFDADEFKPIGLLIGKTLLSRLQKKDK